MPPEVGYAEVNSERQRPIIKINPDTNGHPIDMAIGPPLFHAWLNVVKQPLSIEITENEIAKFEKPDQLRFNSCLYPSEASRCSSSVAVFSVFGFGISAIHQIYDNGIRKIRG
jgi:hypothetical protein